MSSLFKDDSISSHPPAETRGVCIIVLNWNGKTDTLACLASLGAVTYPSLHLVVVDNGSSDGSEDAIRAAFPGVTLLQTGENLGYAGGNNVGFRHFLDHRTDEFVLVLNNDVVVDPGFVTALVDAAIARPDGSVFGPKVYFQNPQDHIWSVGGHWDRVTATHVSCGEGQVDRQQFDEPEERDFIVGCAMLIPRTALRKLQGFDERFFLVHEECELCYRAKAHGGGSFYVPTSKIWHKVSASFGNASHVGSYFWSRNRFLFAEIHLPLAERIRLFFLAILEVVAPPLSYSIQPGVSPWKRVYWTLRRDGLWSAGSYRHPFYRARLYGLRDYVLRRFGNCSGDVRRALSR